MTEYAVVPEGTEPAAVEESASVSAVPSGPRSPLAILQGKRSELEATLYKDLKVPRWDDLLGVSLWVRYRPIDTTFAQAAGERREKAHRQAVGKGSSGDPDWPVRANADALVKACVAIYDLPLGEEPPEGELDGDLPTFGSSELSEMLGAPKNAVETVLKLYATNPDVQLAFAELLGWSGQTSEEARASFLAS